MAGVKISGLPVGTALGGTERFPAVQSGVTVQVSLTGATLPGVTLSGTTTLPGSGQISSTGWIGIGGTPTAALQIQGNISAAAWTTGGINFRTTNATFTDTTGTGTVAEQSVNNFATATIAASSAVTYTRAGILRIGASPTAGSNVTITVGYSLITAGAVQVDGNLNVGTTGSASGGTINLVRSTFPSVIVQETGGSQGIYASNGAHIELRNVGAGSLKFYTTNVQVGMFNSNGNFGILNTNPQVNLSVGTTAGTARIYNSFTDAGNGEWGEFSWSSNVLNIGTSQNGTGVARAISIRTSGTQAIEITTGQEVRIATAKALNFRSGSNSRAGNATLVAGTVTVSNTTVTANTIVLLTRKTSGGTLGTAITYTLSAGASFTINSDSALDTSTFSYALIENS